MSTELKRQDCKGRGIRLLLGSYKKIDSAELREGRSFVEEDEM